jgi:hypothetical protein
MHRQGQCGLCLCSGSTTYRRWLAVRSTRLGQSWRRHRLVPDKAERNRLGSSRTVRLAYDVRSSVGKPYVLSSLAKNAVSCVCIVHDTLCTRSLFFFYRSCYRSSASIRLCFLVFRRSGRHAAPLDKVLAPTDAATTSRFIGHVADTRCRARCRRGCAARTSCDLVHFV